MHTKCQNCGQGFDVDEAKLDAMKVVTCPNCSSSFQYKPFDAAEEEPKGQKDDFGDFFEVDEGAMEAPQGFDGAKPQAKGPAQKPKEEITSKAADFMDEVQAQNTTPPKDEPKETDDKVFGTLEGFEEFLNLGEDSKPKKPDEPKKTPPKPSQPQQTPIAKPSPKKDMIDDAFEELFAEPPKKTVTTPKPPVVEKKAAKKEFMSPHMEAPPKPEAKVPAPQPKTEPKTSPPPKKKQKEDTVSDEAFEALFHDVKREPPPKMKAEGPEQEAGLGIELPDKKKRFYLNYKLILSIVVPVIILGLLSYVTVFTKKGLFGVSFYSYFIEGYKKPSAEVMNALNKTFETVKERFGKDYYPDYLTSMRDLKDILSKDPRYLPAHAYLVYLILLTSGNVIEQNTKKEIESYLDASEKIDPSLNEGVLARAFYNFRSGNLADSEKVLRGLIDGGNKDPLTYEIMGNINFSRGGYSQARNNFERSLGLDKENLRVKHSLAMAIYNDGKTDEALSMLDELRKEPFNHLPSLIDWNYIRSVNQGKTGEAKRAFLDIFEKSPDKISGLDYARLAGYLSDIYYREGKLDEASKVLVSALQRERYDDSIAFRLGVINEELGKPDSAEFFKKAVTLAPQQPVYYIRYARALRKNKDLDGALEQINKSLELEPNNMDAHFEKGLILRTQKNDSEAFISFETVLKMDSSHLDALLEAGEIRAREKKYGEASEYFSKAISINGGSARAHSGLGIAYVGLGEEKKALSEFETARRLSPNDPVIIVNIGKSLLAMGKLPEARANFEKALNLDKSNIDALSGLGDIHFRKGDHSAASGVYKEALTIAPKDIDLMVRLAKSYVELKQYKPALEQLLEASKISVDYFPTVLELGIVYRNLGSMDDSLRELEKSTSIKPSSAEAHYEYGVTLIMNAQVSQGIGNLLESIENDGSYLPPYEKLVEFYYDTGDLQKAVEYSKKILDVDPKRWESRLKLAECYRKMGKDKEAYNTYIEVIKQNPQSPIAYIGAGKVLEDSTQYESALRLYKEARRVAPKNPFVYYHLGYVYKYLQSRDMAIDAFRRYLVLEPDSPESKSVKEEISYLEKM